jgi:hypothetical protein
MIGKLVVLSVISFDSFRVDGQFAGQAISFIRRARHRVRHTMYADRLSYARPVIQFPDAVASALT